MSKIETGRYSELLRRQLGQKGQEQVASELSPEISPVFQLESAEWDLSWYYLKGVKACGVAELIRANAAAPGHMRITNRFGSGVLATITRVSVSSAVSNFDWAVNIADTVTTLANAGLPAARDGRWPRVSALSQSALTVTHQATAGTVATGAGTLHRGGLLARVLGTYDHQVVLPPGFSLTWGALNANVEVELNAQWFERPVAALELS